MVAPVTPETDPFEAAAKALKAGDLEEARRILTALIAKNPRSVTAWELVYQASKNDEERVHALKAIMKLSPTHPWARKKLSVLQPGLWSVEESKTETPPPSWRTGQAQAWKKTPQVHLHRGEHCRVRCLCVCRPVDRRLLPLGNDPLLPVFKWDPDRCGG